MSALAGTWALVKLALRRDRLILPIWITVFVASAAASASAGADLFPTAASRLQLAETTNSTPMLVALYGRVYEPSVGALSLLKLTGVYACAVAVFAFILVIRHSRKEEETGRLDVVESAAVGRGAPLVSAWIVAVTACALIGSLSAASLVAVGLPASGAIAFGLGWFGVGLVFAAVGGLTAQLSARARVCSGLAAGFLALSYVVRAVGDALASGPGWVSWLSPIGWSQQLRPFAGERWAAFIPTVVFSVLIGAAAIVLLRRRDLGSGLLADRPGRPTARRALSSPFGLARHLDRGLVLAWSASFLLGGLLMGGIASGVGDALSSPQSRDLIEKMGGSQRLSDAYLAAVIGILAIVASAFGIQASMRLHAEEESHRSEVVLAGADGRTRYLLSHVVVSFGGVAILMLIAGVSIAVGQALDAGTWSQFGVIVGGAAAQIPVAVLIAAVPVVLFGLRSSLAGAAWGIFGLFVLIGEVGPLVEVPRWVLDLSPFAHSPKVPGGQVDGVVLAVLAIAAVVLVVVGTAAYQRRDIS